MATKEPFVYVDGEYLPKSQAKISVYDHGFLYGDGVFEGIRAYGGVVFRLREHIDRLYGSAKAIKLTMPSSKEEMTQVVLKTLRKNNLKDAYIRLVVSRGRGDLGVDPRKCRKPSVVCITEHVESSHGTHAKARGVSMIISSVRRDSVDATSHEIKSLNYLNSILAKLEAIDAGVDDSIMLDSRGMVSEATTTNIFMVKGGEIATPPPTAGILHGVTRQRIILLARELGFKVVERDITPYELMNADEIFLTGTMGEVLPLVKIRGIEIGDGKPGPVTKRIIQMFEKIRNDPKEGVAI